MKRIMALILIALLCVGYSPVSSEAAAIPAERQLPRLVDDADILTDYEESELLALLDEISERQGYDVAVVTKDSIDGQDVTAYADDFYDYNGYGQGAGDDGILLLVTMLEREWAISTYGAGISAFTDAGQDEMMDKVTPKMSDGDYYAAFTEFANICDDYIEQAENGKPYDPNNAEFTFGGGTVAVCFVIGFIIALIAVSVMKSKLKSVAPQRQAHSYVRDNSFKLTGRSDLFLFHTVSKTAKPKNNGSGSSTHRSSSGRSHGGSRGGF